MSSFRKTASVTLMVPAPTRTTSGWFVEVTVALYFLLSSAIEIALQLLFIRANDA